MTWQNSLEYRVEFLAHLVLGVITLIVLFFVWSAIFKQVDNFSGYTFSSMISYLVMVRFLHFAARGNTSRMMADEIKEGKISLYLIKPVSYLGWWFSCFLAGRLFEAAIRFSIIIFFVLILPQFLSFPSPDRFAVFLLFIPISLLMNYIYNSLIAYLAFFVTDIRIFRTTVGLISGFFAGELIPIDIMPGFLKNIGSLLPFQYMLFFPIKIFQGTLSNSSLISGVAISLAWIIVLIYLSNFLWRKGLKRYEAIGQ